MGNHGLRWNHLDLVTIPLRGGVSSPDVCAGFEPDHQFAQSILVPRLDGSVRAGLCFGFFGHEVLLQHQGGGQPLLELQLRRGERTPSEALFPVFLQRGFVPSRNAFHSPLLFGRQVHALDRGGLEG